MNVKITGGECSGVLEAIPSKSYAHRIAICNFLAKNQIDGGCGDFSSNDIKATEKCLKALVRGDKELDCGESGSTLRFLLPLVLALGGKYTLLGHGKLMERPNDELMNALKENGVEFYKDKGITVEGKLKSGVFSLRGDVSSQYVSGLLMALPILSGDSEIRLTSQLASKPYVDITIEVLKEYGIEIEEKESGFFIKGNQQYKGNLKAEGDWSNAAFFLALGGLTGEIKVKGLNQNSAQGDRAILNVLSDFGAKVTLNKDSVTIKRGEFKPFTFDANDCPDLVPILAVLASFAKGESKIIKVERLKIKESDRIETVLKMLSSFGVKGDSDGKTLTVYGGNPKIGKALSFNDHRIAMASSIMACSLKGTSEIVDAEAVEKSYPSFFEHLSFVRGGVEYV